MKTTFHFQKYFCLLTYKSFTPIWLTLILFFTSCDKREAEVIKMENFPTFSHAPRDMGNAFQQALFMHNYKITSYTKFMNTFMQGTSLIKDPVVQQSYDLITKNSLMEMFIFSEKNARISAGDINTEEINKVLNSKDVSKGTRKHISLLHKSLDKIKSESSQKNFDIDTEISKELDKMEKDAREDKELTEVEKATCASIGKMLKESYSDTKKSAEKTLSSGKTSCWVCSIVNIIVTVVVVAAVAIALVSFAVVAATGVGIPPAVAGAGAVWGGVLGAAVGIAAAATDSCFVVIDYGQITPGSTNQFLFGITFSPC